MASFGGGTEAYVELLITKCGERFATSTEAFRYVDESNNGFITPADFIVVFERLLAVRLSPNEAAALVAHFANSTAATRVPFDAFARVYDRNPGRSAAPAAAAAADPAKPALAAVERLDAAFGAALDARADSIRAGFLNLDTHRSGFISYDELAEGLNRFGVAATREEATALCELYDVRGDHKISYAEFVRRAQKRERRQYAPHLLRQQDDLGPSPGAAPPPAAPLGEVAAAGAASAAPLGSFTQPRA